MLTMKIIIPQAKHVSTIFLIATGINKTQVCFHLAMQHDPFKRLNKKLKKPSWKDFIIFDMTLNVTIAEK